MRERHRLPAAAGREADVDLGGAERGDVDLGPCRAVGGAPEAEGRRGGIVRYRRRCVDGAVDFVAVRRVDVDPHHLADRQSADAVHAGPARPPSVDLNSPYCVQRNSTPDWLGWCQIELTRPLTAGAVAEAGTVARTVQLPWRRGGRTHDDAAAAPLARSSCRASARRRWCQARPRSPRRPAGSRRTARSRPASNAGPCRSSGRCRSTHGSSGPGCRRTSLRRRRTSGWRRRGRPARPACRSRAGPRRGSSSRSGRRRRSTRFRRCPVRR